MGKDLYRKYRKFFRIADRLNQIHSNFPSYVLEKIEGYGKVSWSHTIKRDKGLGDITFSIDPKPSSRAGE